MSKYKYTHVFEAQCTHECPYRNVPFFWLCEKRTSKRFPIFVGKCVGLGKPNCPAQPVEGEKK